VSRLAVTNCPGPEGVAAYVDGRLDDRVAARFLEHCADCEDCRRGAALLSLPADESVPMPERLKSRLKALLRRPAPRIARRFPARSPGFRAGPYAAAAALLLVALAGVSLRVQERRAPARPVPAPIQSEPEIALAVPVPEPAPEPPPEPVPPAPTEGPAPFVVPPPAPLPPAKEAPPPMPRPEFPGATAAEPPVAHTLAARTLTEVPITDAGGALSVRRKGAGAKERLVGASRLGEGDVVSAERGGSFNLDGRHPVVLGENAAVSISWAPQEQAACVHVRSGEALVDSTAAARWLLTDGRVGLTVKPVKGRFAASVAAGALVIAPLAEPLYAEPDGGRVHALRPGEELGVRRDAAELRRADAGAASRRAALADAGRPPPRTRLWTSCDAADRKREAFVLQEGLWYRNEALMGRAVADRSVQAALGPTPRFGWSESRILRFRLRTNAQAVQLSLRFEDRKYALLRTIPVERRSADRWIPTEFTLALNGWGFRRDDGQSTLTVSTADLADSIRFSARQQDVFGDAPVYLLVDDVQVVDPQ
jgi:hypothetical protein